MGGGWLSIDLHFTAGSPVKLIISELAKRENLHVEYDNVVLEEALKIRTDFKIRGVSVPSALRCILRAYDLDYEHTGFRTIKIVHKNQNSDRPSLEEILTMAE